MSCNPFFIHRYKKRSNRPGFSLVELMAVIVIIGLLAGMVTLSVKGYLLAGKRGIAEVEIAKIIQALDTYQTIYNQYPSNEEGLEALVEPSEKFPEGILNHVPRDPWGNPYQYNHPGRDSAFEIICYGADGREGGDGGDDDISSEELNHDDP